jgi:polyisoprenoid-binding protein YceI
MNLTHIALAATLAAPSLALAASYDLDPSHSSAQFSVRHMMVTNVRGEFGKLSGTVELNEKEPKKSKVEATIDTATINTRDAKRDEHLRSADFFDVEKFPQMTFKSTEVKQAGKGKFKVAGNLTLRGVTRPVVLDVESAPTELKDPWGNVRRGAVATGELHRKDFGLLWNQALESGGVLVGDTVKITLDLGLIRKPDAAGAPAAAR